MTRPRRSAALFVVLALLGSMLSVALSASADARPDAQVGHRAATAHRAKPKKKCKKQKAKGGRLLAKPKKKICGGGKKGKNETRVFTVRYQLQGHFTSSEQYPTTEFYCAGTGYVENADFNVINVANVSVEMFKANQLAFDPSLSTPDPVGTWTQTGKSVGSNDCGGSPVEDQSCSGELHSYPAGSSLVSFGTDAKVIEFDSNLGGVPREINVPTDCRQNQDYAPPPSFDLGGSIGAYEQTKVTLTWAALDKLARGQQLVQTATFVNPPDAPTQSTCQGVCSSSVSPLVSTFTVIRQK